MEIHHIYIIGNTSSNVSLPECIISNSKGSLYIHQSIKWNVMSYLALMNFQPPQVPLPQKDTQKRQMNKKKRQMT